MLLANFNRKEHLRHRAVSLRQHGFLVLFSYKKIANFGRCLGWNSVLIVVVCLWLVPHITSILCITTLWLSIFLRHVPKTKKESGKLVSISLPNIEILPNFLKKLTGTFCEKFVISGEVCHKSIANCLLGLGLTVKESVKSDNIWWRYEQEFGA